MNLFVRSTALSSVILSGSWLLSQEVKSVAESDAASASTITEIDGYRFRHPDTLRLEKIAGQPLIQWPICANFSPDGRLFVCESSGSNAPVQEQVKNGEHRVVVLDDTDGDGAFDRRTVFAEKLMFPEGILWHDGGVLVSAPPQIWHLKDTDGDGACDQKNVWFDAKTLTGCANDLHGPYRGRDGWVYWCKGAFAEQTYDIPHRPQLVTKAAHLFRRHPVEGWIEPVMAGGMDNPVEAAFSRAGDRFFTSTFVQHPGGGKRDGIVHAVYGGVYGKIHNVIDNHPQTGEVMPIMTHLGPAAPSGLTCLETDGLGLDAIDQLVATQFNLQKVSLHRRVPKDGSYETINEDLCVSDRVDFHPTDVLEDADGSLIIVDTGGWYQLCCPTSHLDQHAALGGIYRLSSNRMRGPDDPRGKQIRWESLSLQQIAEQLADIRPAVRRLAQAKLVEAGDQAVSPLTRLIHDSFQNSSNATASEAIWTLGQIRSPAAFDALQKIVSAWSRDSASLDPDLVMAAMQSLALYRQPITRDLAERLGQKLLGQRIESDDRLGEVARVYLEWLARIPDDNFRNEVLETLKLESISMSQQRVLFHALAFAMIEHLRTGKDLAPLMANWKSLASLVARDQAVGAQLRAEEVLPLLASTNPSIRGTATWIVSHRGDWDPSFAEMLPAIVDRLDPRSSQEDLSLLRSFSQRPGLAGRFAELLSSRDNRERVQKIVFALAASSNGPIPSQWIEPLLAIPTDANLGDAAIGAWRILSRDEVPAEKNQVVVASLDEWLTKRFTLAEGQWTDDLVSLWLAALASYPKDTHSLSDREFTRVIQSTGAGTVATDRRRAIQILSRANLSDSQRLDVARLFVTLGPMDIVAALSILKPTHDLEVNKTLIAALQESKVAANLPPDVLKQHFSEHPESVKSLVAPLIEKWSGVDQKAMAARLNSLVDTLPAGDALRGFNIFHGSKASCGACHEIGYRGGNVGPDLTKIGGIRSRRDLIEAIAYPSASLVRSYEPVSVLTSDGQVLNGLIVDEVAEGFSLITGVDQKLRIDRSEVDELRPSKTSVMPAGLDQILTPQELADLVAFLEASR